jgi:hypothetical protein
MLVYIKILISHVQFLKKLPHPLLWTNFGSLYAFWNRHFLIKIALVLPNNYNILTLEARRMVPSQWQF